jgi:uncharacterized coiled-coil protein SlyX
MNSDQHMMDILTQSSTLTISLQMQLALSRAESDKLKEELKTLKEKLNEYQNKNL